MKNQWNNVQHTLLWGARYALVGGVLAFAGTTAQAQTMSLDDCVNYALQHNNTIIQKTLSVQNQEVMLNSSKMSYLPNVSANIGQGWAFGRSTNMSTNSYSSGNSTSTNFNVSASMELFTGFRTENQIKSEKFSLQAATANLEKARKDVGIQVATYYLNALYYRGLANVQRRQVDLDSVAVQNARSLFESGKKPESEVASAEAQLAVSRHSLTEAIGNEIMARLDLMQSLNLEGDVSNFAIMDIDTTQLGADVIAASHVFANAVERYPSILAAKYELESSQYDLKVSRSEYLPKLSLSAGIGTGYQYLYGYHVVNPQTGETVKQKSFGTQLNDNLNKTISLNLSIPIFDRFNARNSMRRARLNIESRTTALAEAQQSLNKEIQQAYWNAIKARDNYISSQKANASTTLAYQYEAERYAAGRGTAYELQQASSKMQKAQQDELQGKYEFLMRLKILEFYSAN